jgi:hypothetical protein
MIYANSSYVNSEVNSSVAASDAEPVDRAPQLFPATLLTTEPPPALPTYPNVYGVWNPSYPLPSRRRSPGSFGNTRSAPGSMAIAGISTRMRRNGGMEYLKDFLVPALWVTSSNGDWATLTNWNSGVTPTRRCRDPGRWRAWGR